MNIFLYQMLLICLAHNFAQICCFGVRQIDGNTTFKNEFHNWTKAMARQALPRLHWQGLLAAKPPSPEPPRLSHVESHVGEVPRDETETAEYNGPETAL